MVCLNLLMGVKIGSISDLTIFSKLAVLSYIQRIQISFLSRVWAIRTALTKRAVFLNLLMAEKHGKRPCTSIIIPELFKLKWIPIIQIYYLPICGNTKKALGKTPNFPVQIVACINLRMAVKRGEVW